MNRGLATYIAAALIHFTARQNPGSKGPESWQEWLTYKIKAKEPANDWSTQQIAATAASMDPSALHSIRRKTYDQLNDAPMVIFEARSLTEEDVELALEILASKNYAEAYKSPAAATYYRISSLSEEDVSDAALLNVLEGINNLGLDWLKESLHNLVNDPERYQPEFSLSAIPASNRLVRIGDNSQVRDQVEVELNTASEIIRSANDWDDSIADRELVLMNLKIGTQMLIHDGKAFLSTATELVINSLKRATKAIGDKIAREKLEDIISFFDELFRT